MHGNAKQTAGGLKKKDLKYNKQGKIVSKKMSQRAKKEKRLQKAGYTTKKGQFGAFKMKGGGGKATVYFFKEKPLFLQKKSDGDESDDDKIYIHFDAYPKNNNKNKNIIEKYKQYCNSNSNIKSIDLLEGLDESDYDILEEFDDKIQVVIHNGSFPTEFQLVKKKRNLNPVFS